MKVDELKSKILQLAIHGKLVEQNENDEPASILLKKIKEEKEKLVENKVIKKEKPLQNINVNEKLFELPNGWEWCRLGAITINHDSKRKPVSVKDRENLEKIYNYYGATGAIDKVDSYIFDGFYLLIGEDGGNFFADRDVAFTVNGKFWANNHVHVLECVEDITTSYLKLFLNSIDFRKLDLITGIAVPKLNQLNLNNIVLALPPVEEQKRIVKKVDELFSIIDELNENKEAMLKNISDTRSKVLQLAIQGQLVEQCEEDEPVAILLKRIVEEKEVLIKEKKIKKEKPLPEITEEEKPFVLPTGWKYVRLNDIVTFENGDRSSKYPSPSEIVDDGIPFINTTNINGDYLNLKKEQLRFITNEKFESLKSGKLKDCDFVVTLRGSIGKVAQFIPNDKYGTGFINAQLLIMRLLDVEISDYMKCFYKSEMFVQQINEMSTGSAQPQLSAGKVKEIIIPLPPLAEQKRIVAKVDDIMSYLGELEKAILEKNII